MDGDDELEDDGASGVLLPPADRLWRHPSEIALAGGGASASRSENRMWGVALLAGAIGALLATGVAFATGPIRTRTVEVPAVEQDLVSPVATLAPVALASGLLPIVRQIGSSCVSLTARDAHGSRVSNGVVFRSDGMLLAVAHTVTGAQTITAVLGGSRSVGAHVVAADPLTDLAVVKLDGGGYEPAPLGTALSLRTGDAVVAVQRSPSATDVSRASGSVDGLDKTITSGSRHVSGLLQISANAGPDAVGGPVLDNHGAVVGITTALSSASIAYATPVDLARQVATQLLSTGKVVLVWLGVEGHDLPLVNAATLGVAGGAVVEKVYESSPAALVGLRAGDVVLGVDNRVVTSMGNLIMAMHALPPGTPVQLTVRREGSDRTMLAILAPRPDWVS